jgi:energy-coupling factor transporter ATP-binding protein EcfA2
MKQLLYLIGVPGSGKTTLSNAVLGDVPFEVQDYDPVPHMRYGAGRIQLGLPREEHGGTDALSMSIAPKVREALLSNRWQYVFGEGDRLATGSFFDQVTAAGWQLRVIWLLTPPGIAVQRRRARGSTQNESWVRGRTTKVYSLGRRYADVTLVGDLPIESLVATLREEEVIQALRGEL